MKKSFKRVLSVALVVIMLTLMIPAGIFTTTAATATSAEKPDTYDRVQVVDPNYTGTEGVEGTSNGYTGYMYSSFVRALNDDDIKDKSVTENGVERPLYVQIVVLGDTTEQDTNTALDTSKHADWMNSVRINVDIVGVDVDGDGTYPTITPLTASASSWMLTDLNRPTGLPGTVAIEKVNFDFTSTRQWKAIDTDSDEKTDACGDAGAIAAPFSPRAGGTIELDWSMTVDYNTSSLVANSSGGSCFTFDYGNATGNIAFADVPFAQIKGTADQYKVGVKNATIVSTADYTPAVDTLFENCDITVSTTVFNMTKTGISVEVSGGTVTTSSNSNIFSLKGGTAIVSNGCVITSHAGVFAATNANTTSYVEIYDSEAYSVKTTSNADNTSGLFVVGGSDNGAATSNISLNVIAKNSILEHQSNGQLVINQISQTADKVNQDVNRDFKGYFEDCTLGSTSQAMFRFRASGTESSFDVTVMGGTINAKNAIFSTANTNQTIRFNLGGGVKINQSFNGTGIANANSGHDYILNIYDCEWNITVTGGSAFSTYGTKAVTNMYGGTITLSNTSSTVQAVGIYNGATFNMYGGTITNYGNGGNNFSVNCNTSKFNMYGGTFNNHSSSTGSFAVRAASDDGIDNPTDAICNFYGGTINVYGNATCFGSGTSKALSEGTINVYGGTFKKEKNAGNVAVWWSGNEVREVYIYGGEFYSKHASEDAKWASATYNMALSEVTVTALGTSGYVKADKVTSTTATNKLANTAVTTNGGLIGDVFVQIQSGVTTATEKANVRFIFEMKDMIANNADYAEIGYFVSTSDTTPMVGEAGVQQAVDENGVLYTYVKENGTELWRPEDPDTRLAVLTIENVRNEYFTDTTKLIYITAYVKTASGVYICRETKAISVATSCAADIAQVSNSAT